MATPLNARNASLESNVMRVLIADDNRDAAESLAMLFDLSGHQVRTAADGIEAVDIASHWPPDVAIIDIKMPGLGGREVASALRRSLPETVLVAVSGHLSQRELNLCRNIFDLCFSKGVHFQSIRERIYEVLQSRQSGSPQTT
jgi:CheY-like chemotaxis protein